MTPSSLAGIITAFSSVIAATGGLTVGMSLLLTAARTKQTVDLTHKIVNQESTDRLRYQRALINTLTANGIPVPPDQSIDAKAEELPPKGTT